ncbi:TPA: protein-tyrosine-phosphatase [Candidatus Collierbacteria bacterium]|nr:protein-tyrosine-phosphatase [Candidatus Collierbacteria bacterium]
MLRILVVCSHNKWRSPTAEAIYRKDKRFHIKSAGLGKLSPHQISLRDIETSNLILYMEKDHLERIKLLFPNVRLPSAINLDIPDQYCFMDPELIEILREKIESILVQEAIIIK